MNSSVAGSTRLQAGAARGDITPRAPVFLFGYPHVDRMSTGVHDPLECAALYLRAAGNAALFVAHDLIFLPRDWCCGVRRRIAALAGMPEEAILLSATHTHSGPNTCDQICNGSDPFVPKVDAAYLVELAERVVDIARRAIASAEPAAIGFAVAGDARIGTNRHDPAGPADPEVPVLIVRSRRTHQPIGCMLVCAMHPTVLHEDSTLISADFPHFAREHLRRTVLSPACPIIFHQGASGDQSPRHVTRGNTFAEARRIGELLGRSIVRAMSGVAYTDECGLSVRRTSVDLVARTLPTAAAAEQQLLAARAHHESLRAAGVTGPALRTAECDVFGAEETAVLARAAESGRMANVVAGRSPAEIQLITVGSWTYAGWPGEFFVEYALAVRAEVAGTFVVTLANGELQGYIVTPDAAAKGFYEAGNAIFAPQNGRRFVDATVALLKTGRPVAIDG